MARLASRGPGGAMTDPRELNILEPEDVQDWIDAIVAVAEEMP